MGVIYLTQVPRSGFTPLEPGTGDPTAAEAFYQEVANLETAPGVPPMPMANAEIAAGLDGGPSLGVGAPSGHAEPFWMAYFGVDDVDAAAERARRLGGHVLMPPTDLPGFGRAAVLRDPRGLAFGLFTRRRRAPSP